MDGRAGLQVHVRARDQPLPPLLLRHPAAGRPCCLLRTDSRGNPMSTPSQVVGAFAASHSPGITGWPERATPEVRAEVEGAYQEAAHRIEALEPDALVVVSVEHFTNFNLGNL